MIDFHSHVLPMIDDGSQSVKESLELLRISCSQGINVVVATPHYLPDKESPGEFLVRRQNSFDLIKEQIRDNEFPKLCLGAEVSYFDGMSNVKNIDRLTVSGTNLILVEMPFVPWTSRMIEDLNMLESRKLTVVLAHIERYFDFGNGKRNLKKAISEGFLLQSNANYFIRQKTQKKALSMFNKNQIHFLGSDCHNLKTRPPNLMEAMEVIENGLGERKLKELIRSNYRLLQLGLN